MAGSRPVAIIHCSWSQHADRRWMAMASRERGWWKVARPERILTPERLLERVARLRVQGEGAVLLGLDFPIGLPGHYGALTGLGDFPNALRSFGSGVWSEWYRICNDPGQISLHRPFYPLRPGGRRRRDLLDGLGLGSRLHLLRQCEGKASARPTAGGLFWTLGPGQVGKRTVSGWREVLVPWLSRVALWPFDGALDELLAERGIVVAETFPGAFHLPIGLPARSTWSRKTRFGRMAVAGPLLAWFRRHGAIPAGGLTELILNGFDGVPGSDAAFDSQVGLPGMVEVVEGSIDDGLPVDPVVRRWEGWMLGQQAG